jgi:predicted transposase YdaD
MFQDVLRESWVYQEIGEEFFEKGVEKGREEERQHALRLQRQVVVKLVQGRFPELTALAEHQVSSINNLDMLQALMLHLLSAESLEEMKQVLFEGGKR